MKAVDGLERALRQVLVRPVDRVTGLEADDPAPAPLREERAGRGGILVQLREGRLEALEDGDRTPRRNSRAARKGARRPDAPRQSSESWNTSRSLSYS